MFKISELNPKDKVLDEIHQIQRGLAQEDKGLSSRELVRKLQTVRRELSKKYHFSPRVISSHKANVS
ncbi:MAG: hypothetical protein HY762_07345 [Planctomycetes bacterium]|nr:hypothetical protein [Planctomycetota bacterium]